MAVRHSLLLLCVSVSVTVAACGSFDSGARPDALVLDAAPPAARPFRLQDVRLLEGPFPGGLARKPASVKITEILKRRTGQHGWCDTEAIGFLPQAVGLSRGQCKREPALTPLYVKTSV